jgi:hypothetical protein
MTAIDGAGYSSIASDEATPLPAPVLKYQRSSVTAIVVALAIGAALGLAGFLLYRQATVDCPDMRGTVQLAATNDRLADILKSDVCHQRSSEALPDINLTEMFVSDLIFIAGYWLIGTIVLAAGWWRYEAVFLRRLLPLVVWLPSAVALLDVVEDLLLFFCLRADLLYHPEWAAIITFFVAWSKWIAVVLTLIAAVMSLTIWWSRRADAFSGVNHAKNEDLRADRRYQALDNAPDWADPETLKARKERGKVVGICVSGGGIRASAFGLGVLSALEKPAATSPPGGSSPSTPPVTEQARYLAAVSGGAWAATAWAIQRSTDESPASAAQEVYRQLSNETGVKGFQRQKYIVNGRGSILGLIAWALGCSMINIILLGLLLFIVVWPLGYMMGMPVMRPDLRPDDHTIHITPDATPPLIAGAVFAGLGIMFLIICGWSSRSIAKQWIVGIILIGLGVFTASFMVWIPDLFIHLKDSGPAGSTTIGSVGAAQTATGAAVATSLLASMAAAVWHIVQGPILSRATGIAMRLLPKLIGLVVLVGCLAWSGVVLYSGAHSTYPRALWIWLGALAIALAMYILLNPNWPTLHNVFSKRLNATFDPHNWDTTQPSKLCTGLKWDELARASKPTGTVPELILCCAQQRNGIARGGIRAESFTISPHWVRLGKRSLRREQYVDVTNSLASFRPEISNVYGDMSCVTPWLATTGAAFSSAMGRQSLGSANALMATVNADLGIWLPNALVVQLQWLRWWQQKHHRDGAELRDEDYEHALGTFDPNMPCGAATADSVTGGTTSAHGAKSPDHDRADGPSDEELRQKRAYRERRTREWKRLLPRPRFAYILKEILGWYSARDRYVFITDGGHWENLGLVELMRRHCDVIYCIDASGDPPGSFATLREAFTLASLELGRFEACLDLNEKLDGMMPSADAAPAKIAHSFKVDGIGGAAPVVIHYTKLQTTQQMPDELQLLAVADQSFPHYSTARQLLNARQFKGLYDLGRFAGEKLKESAADFQRRAAEEPSASAKGKSSTDEPPCTNQAAKNGRRASWKPPAIWRKDS